MFRIYVNFMEKKLGIVSESLNSHTLKPCFRRNKKALTSHLNFTFRILHPVCFLQNYVLQEVFL